MSFDAGAAAKYDKWYLKSAGHYADFREKELFLKLVKPQKKQQLLEVGCGTGHNLEFFRELGLDVTGVDTSQSMLEKAAQRLGPGARLCRGQANKLDFADKSFDIVALITVLEFLPDPAGAIREAARVSRKKIYLGVLNKTSMLSLTRRVKGRFGESIYNQAKFYTIGEIEAMVHSVLSNVSLNWQSVLLFPLGWHRYCHWLDGWLTFRKNPFGAFLGVRLKLH